MASETVSSSQATYGTNAILTPQNLSISADSSEVSSKTTPINFCSRLIWNFCQCLIASDYQETLGEDDTRDQSFLLPQNPQYQGKNTLVLDLDETLIHSWVTDPGQYDFMHPFLDAEGENYLYVRKRPGLDLFLERAGQLFEVITFTASTQLYASPIIDQIDPNGAIQSRIYRPSCTILPFGAAKDLNRLGRDLHKVIIIDVTAPQNTPHAYFLQPENAVPISTWLGDPNDRELIKLIPILEILASAHDVIPRIRYALQLRQLCSHQLDIKKATRYTEGATLHRKGLSFSKDETIENLELKEKRVCFTDTDLSTLTQ